MLKKIFTIDYLKAPSCKGKFRHESQHESIKKGGAGGGVLGIKD